MMQRRGGKRIRMDEPPPPEYESPMTPMTPLDGSGTELQEPYTPYTPYSNQPATPMHTGCVEGSFPGSPFFVFVLIIS
jgi:cohesin complex subunit SA-1/2